MLLLHKGLRLQLSFYVILLVLQFLAHLSDPSSRLLLQNFKLLLVILAQVYIEQVRLLDPEKVLDQLLLLEVDLFVIVTVLDCLHVNLLEVSGAAS